MMNKLKGKSKIKAILKVLISVLVESLLIIVCYSVYEEGEEFAAIFCGILWSIVCVVYCISGLSALLNDNKRLKQYLSTTNITINQLEEELKSVKKIGNIYIGNKHLFSNDSSGVVVIPINSITNLEIAHLGANPAKLRNGYYYLYIYSNIFNEKIKIYSIHDLDFKKVIEEIKK